MNSENPSISIITKISFNLPLNIFLQFDGLARGHTYFLRCFVKSFELEDKGFYQSFILESSINRDTNLYSSIYIPSIKKTSSAIY